MASPAKKVAKKPAAKPAAHPKYIEMITAAIAALKDRKGSSRQAIIKYIKANYKVSDNCEVHIKQALRKGVAAKVLAQPKGVGSSGSFKVVKVVAPKKPKAKKPAKKPAAKKPAAKKAKKKPAAKKPAKKAKKPAAKKPAAKKPAAKKAKKPAAKKAAKKSAKK